MSLQKSVLVTGATGAVGPRIVQALCQAGWQVRTYSLAEPPRGWFPTSVEERRGDVTDLAAVRDAVSGMEGVIHLAALLHKVDPTPEMREEYQKINVGGTRVVVQAAREAGVRRFILFSTIAVYGDCRGEIVDEKTRPQPDTFYAQTKLEAEKIVLTTRRKDDQLMGTVLRLAAVYGSRIKGNYRRLAQSMAHGRFISIGNGRNRRTLVYDKDVADAAVLALDAPSSAAAGRVFNVTDGKIHPLSEIIRAISAALDRRPPLISVPFAPARLAAGLLEDAFQLAGRKSPIGRAALDKLVEDTAVDGSLIQRKLGFKPQYDLLSGWRETIAEMRQASEL